MKLKDLLAIWLIAITLSSIYIIGMVSFPLPDHIKDSIEQTIPPAPIMVIGSSLMRSAIPGIGSGNEGGLLGDGRSHTRLAISGIREEQALYLLERLLKKDVKVIFLEANPFIFDFATYKNNLNSTSSLFLTELLRQKSKEIAAKVNFLLKRGFLYETLTDEPRGLFDNFKGDINQRKKYPLYLRPPKYIEKLEKIIKILKYKGIKLILIAPPRSMWSAQFIDDSSAKELELSYQRLAKRFDILLFQPDPFWSNENFVDSGHLNNFGRERFLKELKVWWSKHQ